MYSTINPTVVTLGRTPVSDAAWLRMACTVRKKLECGRIAWSNPAGIGAVAREFVSSHQTAQSTPVHSSPLPSTKRHGIRIPDNHPNSTRRHRSSAGSRTNTAKHALPGPPSFVDLSAEPLCLSGVAAVREQVYLYNAFYSPSVCRAQCPSTDHQKPVPCLTCLDRPY
jgi:hypothetical protein